MKWQKVGFLGLILLTLLLMTSSVKAAEPTLLIEGEIPYDRWSVSRNGQWLAWQWYGRFRILNLDTGEERGFRVEGDIWSMGLRILSPTGEWIYYTDKIDSEYYTCRVNVNTPDMIEPLFNQTANILTISPDGNQLAYWQGVEIAPDNWVHRLYIRNADGSGTPTHILELEWDTMPTNCIDWSVNDQIIFTMTSNGDQQVRTIDCFGDNEMTVLGVNTSCDYFRWSPDGTRLCYVNTTDQLSRLYVADAFLGNPRWIPLRSSAYGSNDIFSAQWKDHHNIIFAPFPATTIVKLYIVNVDTPDITPPPDSSPIMLIGVAVGAGLIGASLASIVMWLIIRRRS